MKGGLELQKGNEEVDASHFLQWSVKAQHERIDDLINEWERLDSAGYSLPYDTSQVLLFNTLKTSNQLRSYRFSGYLQDTYTWRKDEKGELRLSAGVRASYWDLNQELLISPRAQLLYKPLGGKRDISYRLATGLYYQAPFYRELRGFDGTVNTGLLAQKSFHLVGGFTLDFYLGKRNPKKFRFITEAYYKNMWDLVSYEIENVRIRYRARNNAEAYAYGLDLRLAGEFVPGTESWVSFGYLRTEENIDDRGYIARPTDQRLKFGVLFQDYVKVIPNLKGYLNLVYNTGLPGGSPSYADPYDFQTRLPDYKRADLGASYVLVDENSLRDSGWLKPFKYFSIGIEIFKCIVSITMKIIFLPTSHIIK